MAIDTRYVTHSKWTSLSATELTYPNGRQVTSGYDALYRRNTVNETSGGASIAAWQFFGNRTATVALGNGITCSFMNNAQTNSAVQSGVPLPAWGDKTTDRLGYDGSARMIAKRCLPSGSTTSLVGFTTAYDPSSNKQFERALQGDESRSALYPAYDSMDRLLQYQRGILASGGGSVTTPITLPGTDNNRIYNLDGLGNWKNTVFTPEGGSPTTEIRQHNKLNEITQFATTPVTYDHGNNTGNSNPLIAQRGNGNIANDGTRIYAYDALNRLTTVKRKSDNAQVAAYTYDALGRRVLKTVTNGGVPTGIANVTYRYLYDGQQIVEELLVTSGPTYATLRQFVWGQYIDELIQLNVPSNNTTPPLTAGFYYPLQDLLYRTTATTDSSGAIKEAYDYDAYGNTLMFSAAGTGGNWWADNATTTLQPMCEFLFTGRQYDPETQIYWYRARNYSPRFGRFISRDWFLLSSAPNLYGYVYGMPTILCDFIGLLPTIGQGPVVPPLAPPPSTGNNSIGLGTDANKPFVQWPDAIDFVSAYLNHDWWSGSRVLPGTEHWNEAAINSICVIFVPSAQIQKWFHPLVTNNPKNKFLESIIKVFNAAASQHEDDEIKLLSEIWGRPSKMYCCLTEDQKVLIKKQLTNERNAEFLRRQNEIKISDEYLEGLLAQVLNEAGINPPSRFPAL